MVPDRGPTGDDSRPPAAGAAAAAAAVAFAAAAAAAAAGADQAIELEVEPLVRAGAKAAPAARQQAAAAAADAVADGAAAAAADGAVAAAADETAARLALAMLGLALGSGGLANAWVLAAGEYSWSQRFQDAANCTGVALTVTGLLGHHAFAARDRFAHVSRGKHTLSLWSNYACGALAYAGLAALTRQHSESMAFGFWCLSAFGCARAAVPIGWAGLWLW